MYTPDESEMSSEEKAYNSLYYHIGREGLECVDNLRVARKGDPEEVEAYLKQTLQGCCGFFDLNIKIDGETWLVGCNHGH